MNLPIRNYGGECGSPFEDATECGPCHPRFRPHHQAASRRHGAHDGQILAVRSHFLTTGAVPEGVPSPLVRSWQRSSQFGFASPTLNKQRDRLAESGIKSLKERNNDLIMSALDEMASLGEELSAQWGVVILTDPSGIVLARQGNGSFSLEADRLGLNEGFDWSEEAIGTNAIGTVALERTALTITGAEHLFCLNTSISCSAVPILDPSGALAGVLDVSTSLSVPHDYLPLLLRRSALEIERRLFEQRFPRHLKLRFHSSEHLFGGIRDGLLAFDDDRLVGANRAALELIGHDWPMVGMVRFEELFTTGYDTVERMALSGKSNLRSTDGREFFASLQLPAKSAPLTHSSSFASSNRGADADEPEQETRPHLIISKMQERGTLRFRKMKAGQLLYGANLVDACGEAILVFASGRYRCFASHEGRELTLFRLAIGDAIPLGADLAVEVCADGDVIVIPRTLFQKLLRKYPEFGSCVMPVIERLLGQSLAMVGDMAFRSVRHRVIRHICTLADHEGCETQTGTVIEGAPSGEELATAIGAARQSVSTVLAELIRCGEVYRPSPRTLIIPNIDRLRVELESSA
ncbi:GAF domain-containing protein [Pleomorphomonas sp. PLEO]|uniref:GAF domain-containing protein n=1 Tax=Pleomorphomonas sp. PLEO TaxID=3239306 RepID=UPI00351EEAA8